MFSRGYKPATIHSQYGLNPLTNLPDGYQTRGPGTAFTYQNDGLLSASEGRGIGILYRTVIRRLAYSNCL